MTRIASSRTGRPSCDMQMPLAGVLNRNVSCNHSARIRHIINSCRAVNTRFLIILSVPLICAAPVTPAIAADETVDLAFLLSRFDRHAESLERAIIEFDGDQTRTSLDNNEIMASDRCEGRIDVSADLKSYHFYGTFVPKVRQAQRADPRTVTVHEVLVTPDQWLLVDHDTDSRKPANGDRFAMSTQLHLSGNEWSARLADPDLEMLFGYMPRGFSYGEKGGRIADLLRSIQCTFLPVAEDTKDDSVGIFGKADGVEIQVLFNPETDFSVRRLSVTRADTEVKPGATYNCTLDILETRQSNGQTLPSRIQMRHKIKGGTIKRLVARPDKLEDFHVEPAAVVNNYSIRSILIGNNAAPMSFTLREQVPDGTFVRVTDARHLRHVWRDGQVVPEINEQIAAPAESAEFQAAPSNWRKWLLSANVLAIFAICLILYFTRRRRR